MNASRPKVLLLLTSSVGGAGVQACQLARGLHEHGFEVTVAFGPGHAQDADFAALDVPVVSLPLSRRLAPLTNLRGLWRTWRLMRRERFDVLFTSCSIAGLVGRVAGAAARVPVRVHVVQVYASRPHQPRVRQAVFRWIERGLDALTTRYVCVSDAMRRFGVDSGIFEAEKAEVIFNAAELPAPAPRSRERLRAELGIGAGAPLVATLGRLEPQKGVDHFLRAAARVLEQVPEACFLVVGDGPLRAELEALARDLGIADAVRFAGWRRDVPEVLGASDVLALASLWEPFGIVLAEAMLAGLPVVASRVDGIPEVLVDGETGHLVAPGDEAALAARLVELARDPSTRSAMGRAGATRAGALFSVDRMVTSYVRLLGDLFPPTA